MIKLIIILLAVIGGGIGTYLFMRNNPKKTDKINQIVDVIKK